MLVVHFRAFELSGILVKDTQSVLIWEGDLRVNRKRSKTITGAVATLALAWMSGSGALAMAATTPPPTPPAPLKTLVALGDSITFGYNMTDTHDNTVPSTQYAFPYLIGEKEHLKVTDLGIPGWTSTDLLSALHSANFLSAIHGASVITLDIGSNDLLHWAASSGLLADAQGTTVPTLTVAQQEQVAGILTQFGKNLAATLGIIRLVSNAPVVLYNLYDPFPSISPLHAIAEPLETVQNKEIATVAALYKNVSVANAYSAFNNNQLSYVRVLEGDVHPTVLGQSILAKIGEAALLPMIGKEPDPNAFSGVTDLLARPVAPTGGSVAGVLDGNKVDLTIPASSLNQGTEVALTSQEPETMARGNLPFAMGTMVAEAGVNFMAGTTLDKPYTLTITNPSITKDSLVFALVGTSVQFIGSAHVSAGQATVTGVKGEDFIVLSLPTWW